MKIIPMFSVLYSTYTGPRKKPDTHHCSNGYTTTSWREWSDGTIEFVDSEGKPNGKYVFK